MKITFEGTPEEIAKAFPGLTSTLAVTAGVRGGQSPATLEVGEGSGDSSEEAGEVSVEVARKCLTRIPLAAKQLVILRALYAAHPRTVDSAALVAKLGYSRPQFTGLMGAFGRRVANTPGYVDGSWFFEQEWDGTSNVYGLPPSVREAMRLEKLV
jgi:hypothetical protein